MTALQFIAREQALFAAWEAFLSDVAMTWLERDLSDVLTAEDYE